MRTIKTFEAFVGEWDSSIKELDAKSYDTLLNELCEKINSIEDESKKTELEEECNKRLDVYDKEIKDFVVDSIFYNGTKNYIVDIIELGDQVISKYGTEPIQVLNAIDDCYSTILKFQQLCSNETITFETASLTNKKLGKTWNLTGSLPSLINLSRFLLTL